MTQLLASPFAFSQTIENKDKTEVSTKTNSDEKKSDDPPYEIFDSLESRERQMTNSLGEPNKRRIRRFLSMIAGVKTDEEFLIPNVPLAIKGPAAEKVDIQRIKNTDVFRILGKEVGSGVVTIHNQKTGQIYVEMHVDIRDSSIDKTIRELKSLLVDIEGVEYKVVNGGVVLDGYVILPQDLMRISNVIAQLNKGKDPNSGSGISSLVSLSPIARKKIIEYISREINNPEVTISTAGDYIKLEGSVNSDEEKKRIKMLVEMYLPAVVTPKPGALDNVDVKPREIKGGADQYIVDLITVRKQEEQEQPPPKLIQVVVHFVEFSEKYDKKFSFNFSPSISTIQSGGTQGAQVQQPAQSGGTAVVTQSNPIDSFTNLVNNLIPKLNWGKTHGYLRVLDTASVLIKNDTTGSITRTIQMTSTTNSPVNVTLSIKTTPKILLPRSGLIELPLEVSNQPSAGGTIGANTLINTTITVRDRQSAAFGGTISKGLGNDYGAPYTNGNAVFTMNAEKSHKRYSGNNVVFVTPIIKTSASAGVDQVKKKFRLKE